MCEFWGKTVETTFLIILCCNRVSAESRTLNFFLTNDTTPLFPVNQQSLIPGHLTQDQQTEQSRTYYTVPAAPLIPADRFIDILRRAFDPISILASLAFLAFLIQSFAALFDRTRSIFPTIISSRRSSSDYDENFFDIEKRVLRALEEYASLKNELLESKEEKSTS
ncbi:uncharacterized protein LOC131663884 [Phymastichus coffea]|uniref:uncharacterized protein LOC131663884 n=1 Tax=Phymastichus coffea TaxID=108790 RepID=UPI00273C0CE1|nr:uncharacterized protein LOC131663884 [Phymastichus coffea]